MIYFYDFFLTKSTIFNLFMLYEYAFQIKLFVMELTLICFMTLSNTFLLEKTSGDKFCPQRSVEVIWTTEYVALLPFS